MEQPIADRIGKERAIPWKMVQKPSSAPYKVSNVTVDRTYNANATSTAELADVLGTLIQDLRNAGIIG